MSQLYEFPGHLIRRMHQVSVAAFVSETSAAGFDLTPVQFAALYLLRERPGIDQATLATLIAYDRVTIGGVVSRLAARRYIRRAVSKSDRRARQLTLTADGAALLEAVSGAVSRSQQIILGGLSEEEQSALLALLRKATETAAECVRVPGRQASRE